MNRVCFAFLLAACGKPAPPTNDTGALVAQSDDVVVATVDGRPIFAREVALQARTSGADARAALAALVDAEVLAGEAARRGLLTETDVVYARKAEEARLLLRSDFEAHTTPADIPTSELRTIYDHNQLVFDHPEFVEVWNLFIEANDKGTHEAKTAAHDRLEGLEGTARAATTDDEFAALAHDGVKAEKIRFPREGVVEDSFAAAAFALERPGQVSPPVETSYGWHLIRLVHREAPRHTKFEDAIPELRTESVTNYRQARLAEYMKDLDERWHVVEYAERLSRLEDGQP